MTSTPTDTSTDDAPVDAPDVVTDAVADVVADAATDVVVFRRYWRHGLLHRRTGAPPFWMSDFASAADDVACRAEPAYYIY